MSGNLVGQACHGGLASGRLDLLRLQRLRAWGDAAGRRSATPACSSSTPTTRWASAKTARPTNRSSSSWRCARCPTCTSCDRVTRTRPSTSSSSSSPPKSPRRRRSLCSRVRTCRSLARATPRRARRARDAAATSCERTTRRRLHPGGDRFGSRGRVCAAADELGAKGVATRVVALPCWRCFDAQPLEYRTSRCFDVRFLRSRSRRGHARLGQLRRRVDRDRQFRHVGAGARRVRVLRHCSRDRGRPRRASTK